MQCLRRSNVRPPARYLQWQRVVRRRYTDDAQHPAWFSKLREEMLNRKLPESIEAIGEQENTMLRSSLQQHLPWSYFEPNNNAFNKPGVPLSLPLGWHQIHFFAIPRRNQTLPDGSDTWHNPGAPFTRRMWAGGSLRVDVEKYYNPDHGMRAGETFVCGERISEVQLRGKENEEKLFVTIERKFVNRKLFGETWRGRLRTMMDPKDGENAAALIEERTLVFMRDESEEERRLRQTAPARYLSPPGKPDLFNSLTPDPALLFRFSALTFNAHAIHLDPQYAREVEGHKNLLVHGPLSLVLMLAHMEKVLRTAKGAPKVIQSIDYRNLAPLYCGEEMSLCERKKPSKDVDESLFDIWVEGPSAGMAVKGTVKAVSVPPKILNFFSTTGTTSPTLPSIGTKETTVEDELGRKSARAGITKANKGNRLVPFAEQGASVSVRRVDASPNPIPERFMLTPAGHYVRSRRIQRRTQMLISNKRARLVLSAHNRQLQPEGRKRVQPLPLVRRFVTDNQHRPERLTQFKMRGSKRVDSRASIRLVRTGKWNLIRSV